MAQRQILSPGCDNPGTLGLTSAPPQCPTCPAAAPPTRVHTEAALALRAEDKGHHNSCLPNFLYMFPLLSCHPQRARQALPLERRPGAVGS